MNWGMVKYFNPKIDSFPEDPDLYADDELIYSLDLFRGIIGYPINISPVSGALARFTGSDKSQHYAVGRKSTAIDVFCDCDASIAFINAISCGIWGGVGVYFDTMYRGIPHVMFHLDKRPVIDSRPVIWYRSHGKYFYLSDDNNCSKMINKLGGFKWTTFMRK